MLESSSWSSFLKESKVQNADGEETDATKLNNARDGTGLGRSPHAISNKYLNPDLESRDGAFLMRSQTNT